MRFERRERRPEDLRRRLACLGALLLIGACWAGLHACGITVCVFHRLTGLPCLTCGSSRAAALLLVGEPLAALRTQPLAVTAGVTLACLALFDAFNLLALRRVVALILEPRELRALAVSLAALAILNWCYLFWRGV